MFVRILAVLLFAPVVASAQEGFQLPSGNIHCAVYDAILRCDVLNASFAPAPRPRNCTEDWGRAIELRRSGPARLICYGDTVADPRHPVLRYGTAWQGPGMTCTAAETGLRCQNGEGRGFEMSRSALKPF